jgi:hypothetical protein
MALRHGVAWQDRTPTLKGSAARSAMPSARANAVTIVSRETDQAKDLPVGPVSTRAARQRQAVRLYRRRPYVPCTTLPAHPG